MKPNTTPAKIYETAVKNLGIDASPSDAAPDELGCADTVSNILADAGCVIPIIISTRELKHFFSTSPDWVKTDSPAPGDVILCATGEGGRGGITNGHTGIVMKDGRIASNDSKTGTFLENYTLKSWTERWGVRGGYPIYFYRVQVAPVRVEPELPAEVAKSVSDGLRVAQEGLRYPQLRLMALNLLQSLSGLLSKFRK